MSTTLTILALMIPMLFPQAPAAGATGSIEGVVCEVGHCKPIDGVRILLSPSRRTAVTDALGRFRFGALPPGRYSLQVDADDFSLSGTLPLIAVADGQNVKDVKIEMRGLGTISGRALDENGEPIAVAEVQVMRFDYRGSLRMLTGSGRVQTDDRGEFRLPALTPGEYYMRIMPVAGGPNKMSHPITYYPNTTDPGSAGKIVVAGGGEISSININVTARGASVRGKLVTLPDQSVQAFLVLILRTGSVLVDPWIATNPREPVSGDFEIRGVAPGSYDLYAVSQDRPGAGLQWQRVPLNVGEHDVEDIKVPIIPNGTIKGRLALAADAIGGDQWDPSNLTIGVDSIELTPFPWSTSTRVTKTGQFEFAHVPESMLMVRSPILPDGWFVSAVRLNGEDVTASGFSSTPGTEKALEVVVSNVAGTLMGVIKDRQDKPVPAGRLVLLPEPSRRANPFLIRTTVAVEKGDFTLETIAPGEYTAIAFPDEDQFTPVFLRNLDLSEKYERFGQHVHIGPGETTRADLTVAPAESN